MELYTLRYNLYNYLIKDNFDYINNKDYLLLWRNTLIIVFIFIIIIIALHYNEINIISIIILILILIFIYIIYFEINKYIDNCEKNKYLNTYKNYYELANIIFINNYDFTNDFEINKNENLTFITSNIDLIENDIIKSKLTSNNVSIYNAYIDGIENEYLYLQIKNDISEKQLFNNFIDTNKNIYDEIYINNNIINIEINDLMKKIQIFSNNDIIDTRSYIYKNLINKNKNDDYSIENNYLNININKHHPLFLTVYSNIDYCLLKKNIIFDIPNSNLTLTLNDMTYLNPDDKSSLEIFKNNEMISLFRDSSKNIYYNINYNLQFLNIVFKGFEIFNKAKNLIYNYCYNNGCLFTDNIKIIGNNYNKGILSIITNNNIFYKKMKSDLQLTSYNKYDKHITSFIMNLIKYGANVESGIIPKFKIIIQLSLLNNKNYYKFKDLFDFILNESKIENFKYINNNFNKINLKIPLNLLYNNNNIIIKNELDNIVSYYQSLYSNRIYDIIDDYASPQIYLKINTNQFENMINNEYINYLISNIITKYNDYENKQIIKFINNIDDNQDIKIINFLLNYFSLKQRIKKNIKYNDNKTSEEINNHYYGEIIKNNDILKYIDIYNDPNFLYIKDFILIRKSETQNDGFFKYLKNYSNSNISILLDDNDDNEIQIADLIKKIEYSMNPDPYHYYLINLNKINKIKKDDSNYDITSSFIEYINTKYNLKLTNLDLLYEKTNINQNIKILELIENFNYIYIKIIIVIIIIITIIIHIFYLEYIRYIR